MIYFVGNYRAYQKFLDSAEEQVIYLDIFDKTVGRVVKLEDSVVYGMGAEDLQDYEYIKEYLDTHKEAA